MMEGSRDIRAREDGKENRGVKVLDGEERWEDEDNYWRRF